MAVQNRRAVGTFDHIVGVAETSTYSNRSDVEVTLDLPSCDGKYLLTPTMARVLSRRLKKWADMADPPKRRR